MNDQPRRDDEPELLPHAYDGIQEYDQRLPNWWLLTLHGSLVFGFLYWAYYFQFGIGEPERAALDAELARIEARRLAPASTLDDATLWTLSRNHAKVAEGAARFAGAGREVTDRDEFRQISRAVSKKYWVLSTLMDAWEKVARLFRSRETEGAVAWTVDRQL